MSPEAVRAGDARRRSAEATPSSFEESFRELFDEALVGIYMSRPDGTLLGCNEAFARMLGFGAVADAVGSPMSAVYDAPSDRERFVSLIRAHGHLDHHRRRLRRRDGAIVEVIESVVGKFDAAGTLVELRGFLQDVTATADADLALLAREHQFRAVFLDAVDAMLVIDDNARIVDANPAACRLFGCERASPAGQPFDALVAGSEEQRTEVMAAWRDMLALGDAKREHRAGTGAETRILDCSYRARVYKDRHVFVARDVTERRALEERLVQSEKIESVGRLAGGIAHDFNNLLTAILGYTELLLASNAENDRDRADLEEIQKAGQRAAGLTQQLLAFSRKQVLLPKAVDLNQTVSTLRGMLMRLIREDIALSCELAPVPAVIRIDPAQLEQAILNLVLNARDALPAGGRIVVDVAVLPPADVNVPADLGAPAGDFVRLRVMDNGVGISPEARAHLFEPFFTTKELGKGTGLGLASVYGIVRQSHGFITVDSTPGAGSTFTMYFPAIHEVERNGAAPRVAAKDNQQRETILLVEDEDTVRALVAAVLRRDGYRVLEAPTPGRACELFEQHASIDLLLTDIVMPDMNGPALAQRLIGMRPGLRVLFISGYASAAPTNGNNSNVAFLSKPFHASELTDRVRRMFARPGATDVGA